MKYLAVDIGASSGKLVKGELKDGRVEMSVVHRFPNELVKAEDGTLLWDLDRLSEEIIIGLGKAGDVDYVAIDTWGVDFVLLDKDGNKASRTVSYRDSRTERLKEWPEQEKLYARTGIQFQRFNTIYQLLSLKEEHPEELEAAEDLLFVPDYLSWKLTGVKTQEYTFASTSNLLDPVKRDWDRDLIASLGLPGRLFKELSQPGTVVGKVKPEVAERIGYEPVVMLAPSHDSASAVIGAPVGDDSLFLSSGTWSILGTLVDEPVRSEEGLKANLSNEGGTDGTVRLLKNLMGSWMLQNLKKELGGTFDEIEKEARAVLPLGIVDVTDDRFLAPESMAKEVEKALGKENLSRAETASVIYYSLAEGYKQAVSEMSAITGRAFSHIAIVGGGSKDQYLNQLTAMTTGLAVTAGPDEGTAIGNLLYQMIAAGELEKEKKNDVLKASVDIITYKRKG